MKFENDILNELQTLSPFLAGIKKENIFFVPEGYFKTLSNIILISLKEEARVINIKNTEDIPQAYFDNLSASILEKIKAQQKNIVIDERAALPVLLQHIQYKNLFEVPQQYFDNVASVILDKIKAQQKDNPKEELEELSPLLRSIKHTNIFDLPQGYFNTAPASVLNAVKASTAKVVSISKLRWFIKYAAAAVITGTVVLGVYKYTDKPAVSNPVSPISYAKLDAAIEQGKNMNDHQFNQVLNNLTKDDISSYLEKNSSEEDISLLTSNSDEIDLPNKDEYLQNEKTLEHYLDKIKFQN